MYAPIERERKKFVRYVKSLIKETAAMDAEDIVQDVLLRIFERSADVASVENMTAYVYRSLKNRVIDNSRTHKPTISLDDEFTESGTPLIDWLKDQRPNVVEFLMTQQGKEELFEALEGLSEIEKQVIICHEFEGTSFKELSVIWDIPQNTLLSHKSRALKKLHRYYDKRLGE